MGKKGKTIENGVLKIYADKNPHVTIPEGVTVIGPSVFMRNYKVETVTIPEGVTKICENAFFCCYNLQSVTIADSVKSIGDGAFSNCLKLESVKMSAGVKRIEEMAFLKCNSLKSITLPDGLEEIGNNAFSECSNLKSINIPDSLKKIGKGAFKDCKLLKLSNTPNCIPEIGEDAFTGTDPQIKKAFIEAQKRNIPIYTAVIVTVTNLRRHKYDDKLQCTWIKGHPVIVDEHCEIGQRMVYFPVGGQLDEEFANENHLLRLDGMGYQNGYCLHPDKRNVKAVKVHGEVSWGLALPIEVLEKYTDIHSLKDGDRIFNLNGHPICYVYIPEEMDFDIRKKTLVRYCSKKDSPETVYIPWGTEIIETGAFMHCNRITRVVIPETVKTIKNRAFYDCPNLRNVTIPTSVTSIGTEAFAHCNGLSEDILPEKLKSSAQSILNAADFEIHEGVLKKYKGDVRYVKIPEGVTEIGNSAFFGSSRMESVVIPKGVTKIGNRAFVECKRLQHVSIPNTVTYIGYQAFYKCKSLHEITVPASVEYIGDHAFGEYYFFRYVEGFKHPFDEHRKYSGFHIHCTEGSAAELYAWKHNIDYRT